MKKRIFNPKKGLTLVELIVSVAAALSIVMAVWFAFGTSNISLTRNLVRVEISQNARAVLDRISREVRQALEVTSELPDSETDAVSEIKFQDGHDASRVQYIRYFLENNQLKREQSHFYFESDIECQGVCCRDTPERWVLYNVQDEFGNSPTECIDETIAIAENITELKFWGTENVYIKIKLNKNDQTVEFITQINPRNI